MGSDRSLFNNPSPRRLLNLSSPMVWKIDYEDEIGYMYVGCQRCLDFNSRCDYCWQISYEITHEYWTIEEAQAARELANRPPHIPEVWDEPDDESAAP